jgi:hypothetical protein
VVPTVHTTVISTVIIPLIIPVMGRERGRGAGRETPSTEAKMGTEMGPTAVGVTHRVYLGIRLRL